MNFIDYISGNRAGREAHQIEKDSQRDPFLYEAMEGYDTVKGDHIADIQKLQKAIASGKRASKRSSPLWKVAAVIVVLACGFGGYVFINDIRTNMSSSSYDQAASSGIAAVMAIDIFVPEDFYEKNESTIENKNDILAMYTVSEMEEEDAVEIEEVEIAEIVSAPAPSPTPESTPQPSEELSGRMTSSSSRSMNKPSASAGTGSSSESIIDIYVPKRFYDQHKENIDKENKLAIETSADTHNMPITIYIPEKDYIRFKNKIEK